MRPRPTPQLEAAGSRAQTRPCNGAYNVGRAKFRDRLLASAPLSSLYGPCETSRNPAARPQQAHSRVVRFQPRWETSLYGTRRSRCRRASSSTSTRAFATGRPFFPRPSSWDTLAQPRQSRTPTWHPVLWNRPQRRLIRGPNRQDRRLRRLRRSNTLLHKGIRYPLPAKKSWASRLTPAAGPPGRPWEEDGLLRVCLHDPPP